MDIQSNCLENIDLQHNTPQIKDRSTRIPLKFLVHWWHPWYQQDHYRGNHFNINYLFELICTFDHIVNTIIICSKKTMYGQPFRMTGSP